MALAQIHGNRGAECALREYGAGMSATDREREVMDMFSDDPGAFMREVRDWFTLNPEATVRREAGIRDIMLRHFGDEARELFDWQPPDDPASCCA